MSTISPTRFARRKRNKRGHPRWKPTRPRQISEGVFFCSNLSKEGRLGARPIESRLCGFGPRSGQFWASSKTPTRSLISLTRRFPEGNSFCAGLSGPKFPRGGARAIAEWERNSLPPTSTDESRVGLVKSHPKTEANPIGLSEAPALNEAYQ